MRIIGFFDNLGEIKMKKIFIVLLILIMCTLGALSLFSCNFDNVIIVYTETGFAPFEYISNGKICGVDVDIMNLVGEKLGKKVVFENVGFDMIIPTVSAGKLCNVGAAGISITPARQEKVNFSKEYYTARLYVIYKSNSASQYETLTTDGINGVYWESLRGKNIAVQGGTTADLFVGDELKLGGLLYSSGAVKTKYDKFSTAIADVGLNADVAILDELVAKQLVSNNPSISCAPLYYQGNGEIEDEVAMDVYAICVTKGEDALLNAINEVLDELGEVGINALIAKHLGLTN